MSDVLERIGALLAKAENTDNEAEADAYLAKAQEISVKKLAQNNGTMQGKLKELEN